MYFVCLKIATASTVVFNIYFSQQYFYCPQTKLREGKDFTPVCDSVHRRDGVSQDAMDGGGVYPAGRHLTGRQPPG